MNKPLSIFFISLVLLCFCKSYGEISKIKHIGESKLIFENADLDTLVLFDIDRTLLIMNDQALKAGKSGFLKRIKSYPSFVLLSPEEQDNLLSIVLLTTSHQIVEKDVIDIINELQKKNIKTIAFTKMLTGQLGFIPCMEQWRLNTLKNSGLIFQCAFPNLQEIVFYPDRIKKSPLFKNGLLCTSKEPKGMVLKLFLDKVNWYPKKIIMVDNGFSSLESAEIELAKLSIEFQGFHYQYVEDMLKTLIFDEKLITFQINYLLKHHIWLTDEEASPLVENAVLIFSP